MRRDKGTAKVLMADPDVLFRLVPSMDLKSSTTPTNPRS